MAISGVSEALELLEKMLLPAQQAGPRPGAQASDFAACLLYYFWDHALATDLDDLALGAQGLQEVVGLARLAQLHALFRRRARLGLQRGRVRPAQAPQISCHFTEFRSRASISMRGSMVVLRGTMRFHEAPDVAHSNADCRLRLLGSCEKHNVRLSAMAGTTLTILADHQAVLYDCLSGIGWLSGNANKAVPAAIQGLTLSSSTAIMECRPCIVDEPLTALSTGMQAALTWRT